MNLVKAYRSIISVKECFTRYRRLILAGILLINVILILDAAEGKNDRTNYRINSAKHSNIAKEYDELTVSLRRQSKEEWSNLGSRIYEKTIENYLQSAEKQNKEKQVKQSEKKKQNKSDTSWWQKNIYIVENEQPSTVRTRRRWTNHAKFQDGVAHVNM